MLDLHAVILEDLENIVCQPLSWDKLRGKTVLITGASGMIASYLVYTLLYLNETRAASIRVLALVRNKDKALALWAYAERPDFQLLVQDVCDPRRIAGLSTISSMRPARPACGSLRPIRSGLSVRIPSVRPRCWMRRSNGKPMAF